MEKILFTGLLLFFVAFCFKANGQNPHEKIKAAKIGYISGQLNLTPDQSKVFWPVYEQYDKERKELRQKQKGLRDNMITKTDDELRKSFDLYLEIESQKLNLDRKYLKELLKVINIRQVAALYKAESEFGKLLVDAIQDKNQKLKKDGEQTQSGGGNVKE